MAAKSGQGCRDLGVICGHLTPGRFCCVEDKAKLSPIQLIINFNLLSVCLKK